MPTSITRLGLLLLVLLLPVSSPPAVAAPTVTSLTLTADRVSPQPTGTSIQWTAVADGGTAPYSYKWWVYSGGSWVPLTGWTNSATYTWTPTTASSAYKIGVWVKSIGNTSEVDEKNLSMPFTIGAPSITSLSLVPDTAALHRVGATINWTATAGGGVAPYSYKWWVYNGSWKAVTGWTSSATYAWMPSEPSPNARVGVWARSAGNTSEVDEQNLSVAFPISPAVTGLSLVPGVPSPQRAGTSIPWTAAASGGTPPYAYQWSVSDGASWVVARDWNADARFSWIPQVPGGNYTVRVSARSFGAVEEAPEMSRSAEYGVMPGITGLTLTPDAVAPKPPGTTIRWTATASGGIAPFSYKWWVYDGSWTPLTGWVGSATYSWTPGTANSGYKIGVWARSADNAGEVDEKNLSVPFAIEIPQPFCTSVASATLRICDSFSDGSVLSEHTPDFGPGGLVWSRLAGDGDPQIGAGVARATGGDGQIWTTDAGLSNIAVGVEVSSTDASPYAGLVIRATDQNNYLVLRLDTASVVRLYRWQNAEMTMLAESSLAFLQGEPHRLEARAQDDVLQVYIDGIFQFAVIEAFNRTASRHGLLWYPAEDATAAFDNFQVTSSQPIQVPATTDGCTYRPDRTRVDLGPGESHFTITVTASPGCSNWSAQDGHIAYIETFVPSGVYFTMPNNTDPAARTDYPSVAGETITVTQAGLSGGSTGGGVSPSGGGTGSTGSGTTSSVNLPELVRMHAPVSIPQRGTIARPYGEFIWESYPNEKATALNECFGNCGAGCSSVFNPCGGRSQWWELAVLTEPEPIPGNTWEGMWCYGDTKYLYDFQRYRAMGRWTYHGYAAVGCFEHDALCPEGTILGCLLFAGCGSAWNQDWSYDDLVIGSRAVNIVELGPAQCSDGGF